MPSLYIFAGSLQPYHSYGMPGIKVNEEAYSSLKRAIFLVMTTQHSLRNEYIYWSYGMLLSLSIISAIFRKRETSLPNLNVTPTSRFAFGVLLEVIAALPILLGRDA